MDNNEILKYLLGEGSIERLIAAMVYAYLGALLMLLLSTTKRNPLSEKTPTKFSWKYLLSDNSKRIVATVILIFIAIRFGQELLGAEVTMYVAFLIGFGCDRLSQLLKEKNILGSDKKT